MQTYGSLLKLSTQKAAYHLVDSIGFAWDGLARLDAETELVCVFGGVSPCLSSQQDAHCPREGPSLVEL